MASCCWVVITFPVQSIALMSLRHAAALTGSYVSTPASRSGAAPSAVPWYPTGVLTAMHDAELNTPPSPIVAQQAASLAQKAVATSVMKGGIATAESTSATP